MMLRYATGTLVVETGFLINYKEISYCRIYGLC